MHVLFVCTGNVCRSPTAERLALAFAADLGILGLSVESVGTRAMVGFPMHPIAARVLEGLGGDPEGFCAQRITKEKISDAELVLTMAAHHRDDVLRIVPGHLNRTFTLKEAARLVGASGAANVVELVAARHSFPSIGNDDVVDPIGMREDVFLRVGTEIADLLSVLLRRLRF
jgi:protein-tyrosine phosphatase